MTPASAIPHPTNEPAVAATANAGTPIFVVSLARVVERRRAICDHLDQIGACYRLVDAVDGAALTAQEWRNVVDGDIPFHPGTVGCYLTHIRIYEAMVTEKIPVALVLEDDARLSKSFVPVLVAGLHSLDFDYCFLDSDDENETIPVYFDRKDHIQIAPGIQAHRLSAGPQTTHAYMITLEGARKRLGAAFPIRKAIDLYDHLPYPITFRAVVSPKLAWLSEHSLVSFTSPKAASTAVLRFSWLRRHPFFYRLRNWIKLKTLRRSLQIRALVRDGQLAPGKRWTPLPSGRDVVL